MRKQEILETNLDTLSQATELVTKVVKNIAGEEISTTLKGEIFSSNDIRHAVAARLQSNFILSNKGVSQHDS